MLQRKISPTPFIWFAIKKYLLRPHTITPAHCLNSRLLKTILKRFSWIQGLMSSTLFSTEWHPRLCYENVINQWENFCNSYNLVSPLLASYSLFFFCGSIQLASWHEQKHVAKEVHRRFTCMYYSLHIYILNTLVSHYAGSLRMWSIPIKYFTTHSNLIQLNTVLSLSSLSRLSAFCVLSFRLFLPFLSQSS